MSINASDIKPGGRVSVTLTDGTKIIDAPVRKGRASAALFLSDLMVPLLDAGGRRVPNIASIDAYTPPTPEWDRPWVYAVKDASGDVWRRDPEHPNEWGICNGLHESQHVESTYGPCTVLAVYADGVER